MNDRVSVGTSYSDTLFVLLIVAACLGLFAGGLVYAIGGEQPFVVVLLSAGGVAAVLAVARGVWIAAGRQWIEDTDDGFVLVAGGREHKLEDADVRELATKSNTRFANGIPKANVRTGTFRVDAAVFPRPVAFRYEWPLNREDPLIDLWVRLLDRLANQAERELARDGELVGEGWALTRDGLVFPPTPDGSDELPFDRVAAAEVVDHQVCVWAVGEARPCFKVNLDSPNAPVLLQVLAKRLADRPPDDEDPESLGRVIFERDSSHSALTIFIGTVFAVGLFIGGAAALYYYLTGMPNDRPPLALAIGLNIGAAVIALVLWFGRQNVLRCHARGVCRVRNGKATEMRYDEVKVFTYTATRHYHNGAYTGTALAMAFESVQGHKLDYTTTVKNADAELENLREYVSRVVASGMKRRLEAGKVVYWTDRVAFEPDGLDIGGKAGLFGKGEDLFVEWADVADFTLDQGKFALFARHRGKAVYETTVNTPNFFPGFFLILLMREGR